MVLALNGENIELSFRKDLATPAQIADQVCGSRSQALQLTQANYESNCVTPVSQFIEQTVRISDDADKICGELIGLNETTLDRTACRRISESHVRRIIATNAGNK